MKFASVFRSTVSASARCQQIASTSRNYGVLRNQSTKFGNRCCSNWAMPNCRSLVSDSASAGIANVNSTQRDFISDAIARTAANLSPMLPLGLRVVLRWSKQNQKPAPLPVPAVNAKPAARGSRRSARRCGFAPSAAASPRTASGIKRDRPATLANVRPRARRSSLSSQCTGFVSKTKSPRNAPHCVAAPGIGGLAPGVRQNAP
jgi:hypothetical protein